MTGERVGVDDGKEGDARLKEGGKRDARKHDDGAAHSRRARHAQYEKGRKERSQKRRQREKGIGKGKAYKQQKDRKPRPRVDAQNARRSEGVVRHPL